MVGDEIGVVLAFLSIQSSKKPFLGVSGAFGTVLGIEVVFLSSSIGTTSTELLEGSGGISDLVAFFAFSAALQRS